MRKQRKHTGLVLGLMMAAFTGLGGCVSVLPDPEPAPTIYRLHVPQMLKHASIGKPIAINIERPDVPSALSGRDIVVSTDGRQLSFVAGAKWSEPIADLLRTRLIDDLSANGQIVGIIPKGSTRVPYRLNISVRRFEAIFDQGEDAAPLAVVRLNLALTNTKDRKLVASRSFEYVQRADKAHVSSIVNAIDMATSAAVGDIETWLSKNVASGRS